MMIDIDPRALWTQRFWYRAAKKVPEGTAIRLQGRQIGEVVACRQCDWNEYEVEARAHRDFATLVYHNGTTELELLPDIC